MATVEIPVLTVVPSLTGSFCVATLPWTFDSCEITKIRAKLSSGTGTFNAKIATNDTKDAGWDLSQNIVENIGGLYWHVRADDLEEGTSNSDGDGIEWWYSYTKSLTAFRQGTAGSQPLLKTALGPGDTTPTLFFDGSDDRMPFRSGTSLLPVDTDWTVFIVIGDLSTADPAPLIANYDTGNTAQEALYGRDSRMTIQDDDGNKKQTYGASDLPAADQIRCIQFVYSTEKVNERIDGSVQYADGTGPENVGYAFNQIGASAYDSDSNFFNGGISEILIFDHFLSNDQLQAIEGYLAHRWGLTGVLPVSHDYKVTSPFEQGYLVGSNMDLTTSYTHTF